MSYARFSMRQGTKIDRSVDTITITGPCSFTGEDYSVTVPVEGFYKWVDGALIQDAMPEVSADDREFLISGISPAGWDSMFSK